jgi:ABC-2 type transport system permease protein
VIAPAARADLIGELRKLAAFFRRDLLLAFSYRLAFVSDWVNLLVQVAVLGFVGRLVPSSALPTFGGRPVSYLQFVAVGIAIGSFVQLGMQRVTSGVRSEQLMGTLEAILATPTNLLTIQVGWVIYDIVYVPLRTLLFLLAMDLIGGIDLSLSGLLPAVAVLLAFIPFVWGLGVLSAAGTMTFRRGTGLGLLTTLLTVSSGAYFPLTVLPGWLRSIAAANPIALAVGAMREALLGAGGWEPVLRAVVVLVPAAALTLVAGVVAFRLALRRERRRGTVGLY